MQRGSAPRGRGRGNSRGGNGGRGGRGGGGFGGGRGRGGNHNSGGVGFGGGPNKRPRYDAQHGGDASGFFTESMLQDPWAHLS